jgi:hypothetical protein
LERARSLGAGSKSWSGLEVLERAEVSKSWMACALRPARAPVLRRRGRGWRPRRRTGEGNPSAGTILGSCESCKPRTSCQRSPPALQAWRSTGHRRRRQMRCGTIKIGYRKDIGRDSGPTSQIGRYKSGMQICVPRRAKNFFWLGCVRSCSTVVSPFSSESFCSKKTLDW